MPAGKVLIKEASHPTSVQVDVEFPWHVVGHVTDAPVTNPGVAYYYRDGPADSVTLIRKDGAETALPKGKARIIYYHADKPVCTDVDSRGIYKGAKFPVEGTYSIWLLSGWLEEAEAAMGFVSLAGMKEFTTRNVSGFAAFPLLVEAGWTSALLAVSPIVLGATAFFLGSRK